MRAARKDPVNRKERETGERQKVHQRTTPRRSPDSPRCVRKLTVRGLGLLGGYSR